MNDEERKELILQWMSFLVEARDYIIANNKSLESLKHIAQKKYDGCFIEVEDERLGNTGGDWVRLNYADCYLFLYKDGTEEYQFDPFACYGAEVVIAHSYEDFLSEVDKLTNIEQYYEEWDVVLKGADMKIGVVISVLNKNRTIIIPSALDFDTIYNTMYEVTDCDHEIAADAAAWCELASVGETYEFREGYIKLREVR